MLICCGFVKWIPGLSHGTIEVENPGVLRLLTTDNQSCALRLIILKVDRNVLRLLGIDLHRICPNAEGSVIHSQIKLCSDVERVAELYLASFSIHDRKRPLPVFAYYTKAKKVTQMQKNHAKVKKRTQKLKNFAKVKIVYGAGLVV